MDAVRLRLTMVQTKTLYLGGYERVFHSINPSQFQRSNTGGSRVFRRFLDRKVQPFENHVEFRVLTHTLLPTNEDIGSYLQIITTGTYTRKHGKTIWHLISREQQFFFRETNPRKNGILSKTTRRLQSIRPRNRKFEVRNGFEWTITRLCAYEKPSLRLRKHLWNG